MDFSKLETLEKQDDIKAAIHRGVVFGGEIWQMNDLGERDVFPVILGQYDEVHNLIHLKTGSLNLVSENYPIFIRLRYRTILFKLETREFKVFGDHLVCTLPKDVKALAMRTTERYVLPFDLDMSLSIKRFARSLKESSPGLEVRMIDVSEHGIGVLISGMNKDFLRPYDHFWIKAIDQRSLGRDIFGTVLYVDPKGAMSKRRDVRVGLSLSAPLSVETFSRLKNKCRIILSA